MANQTFVPQIRVRILSDQDHKQVIVKAATFLIGRDSECAIQIADLNVSRKQLEVSLANGIIYVTDAGSSNGCFVNSVKLPKGQKVALAKSDRVTFGGTTLALFISSDEATSSIQFGMTSSTVQAPPAPVAPSASAPAAVSPIPADVPPVPASHSESTPASSGFDVQELLNRALGKTQPTPEPVKEVEPVRPEDEKDQSEKVEKQSQEKASEEARIRAQEMLDRAQAQAKAIEGQVLAQAKAKEASFAAELKAKEGEFLKELKAREDQLLVQLKAKENQLLGEAKNRAEQVLAEAKSQAASMLAELKRKESQFLDEIKGKGAALETAARNQALQIVQAAEKMRDAQMTEMAEHRGQIIHDAQERASRIETEAKERFEAASRELERVQHEVKKMGGAVLELKNEKAKIEKETEALLKLQTDARQELKDHKESLQGLEKQSQNLRRDFNEQKKEIEEIKKLKTEISESIKKHESQKQALVDEVSDLLKAKETVEADKKRILAETEKLEVKKREVEQNLSTVMLIINNFEKKRDELASENEKTKGAVDKLTNQHESLVKEHQAHLERLKAEQEQELKKHKAEVEKFKEQIQELQKKSHADTKSASQDRQIAGQEAREREEKIQGEHEKKILQLKNEYDEELRKLRQESQLQKIAHEKAIEEWKQKLTAAKPSLDAAPAKTVGSAPPVAKPEEPVLPDLPQIPSESVFDKAENKEKPPAPPVVVASKARPLPPVPADDDEDPMNEFIDATASDTPFLASASVRRSKMRVLTAGGVVIIAIAVGTVIYQSTQKNVAQEELASTIGAPEDALVNPPAATAPTQTVAGPPSVARVETFKRKGQPFKPQQSPDIKDSYTNSVIYTRDYDRVYLADDSQKRWFAFMADFAKRAGVKRESANEVTNLSKRLVADLKHLKSQMDTENIQPVITAMRDTESATINRMVQLLGSRSKFDQYRAEERKFFTRELQKSTRRAVFDR